MNDIKDHLIGPDLTVRSALKHLNALGAKVTLFIVDKDRRLIGSVTDGDIRRNLLLDVELGDPVSKVMYTSPRSFRTGTIPNEEVRTLRALGIGLVPVVDEENVVQELIDLTHLRPTLPLDAVLMAGGRGSRLRPLTDEVPKPLLKVGEKPIIDHTLDHLADHGVDRVHVSVNYKKDMIKEHLQRGVHNDKISFLEEDVPLGTAGSLSLIEESKNEVVLLMNSDLLTDLDIEDLYNQFMLNKADMAVATSEHEVQVPYAVLELEGSRVQSFHEKPTKSYACNAGIYLIKRSLLERIPEGKMYNATDLLEDVLNSGGKVIAYPISGYWTDIGQHDDLKKARDLADPNSNDL